MPVTLEAGDTAPDFELQDQDGEDDTACRTTADKPWCSTSTLATTRRAARSRPAASATSTRRSGRRGRSCWASRRTTPASHTKFREKYALPFPLLVDEDAKVSTEYGAWGEKTLYGRKSIGMTRSTFVIGPDGTFTKVWKRAQALNNPGAVLKLLRKG